MNLPEEYVTVAVIAKRWGVSPASVRDWMKSKAWDIEPLGNVTGAKVYPYKKVIAWKLTRTDKRR